jgi:hypothetical protein
LHKISGPLYSLCDTECRSSLHPLTGCVVARVSLAVLMLLEDPRSVKGLWKSILSVTSTGIKDGEPLQERTPQEGKREKSRTTKISRRTKIEKMESVILSDGRSPTSP